MSSMPSHPVPLCDRGITQLRSAGGDVIDLDVERFLGEPSVEERAFLHRVVGPVLDVGCGPGRAAAFLRASGTVALGVDASASLVDLARSNGAFCVHQDVFDPVPFEGRWHSVLLLDGNIGIGGDPSRMLARLHDIVEPHGRAYLEVDPVGRMLQLVVREHRDGVVGPPFAWAVVSLPGIDELLIDSGWCRRHVHAIDDRAVVELERIR